MARHVERYFKKLFPASWIQIAPRTYLSIERTSIKYIQLFI